MANQILQYQRLAQPLEPSLTTAPPELSWYFQHPSQPPRPPRAAHYLPYEKWVDTPVNVEVTVDSWFVQHPTRPPALRRSAEYLPAVAILESTLYVTTVLNFAPVTLGNLVKDSLLIYQAKAEPVEPSLRVTPSVDTWYVQHPTKPPTKPRSAEYPAFVYVAEDTVYYPPDTSPALDGWVQPISQPLFRRQPVNRNPYFQEYARPLEPSYLFTPDMATWYVQHPTRPPDAPRAAEYLPVVLVIEDTALGSIADPDGWVQPISQPLFSKQPAAHFLPYDGPLEHSLYQTPVVGWDVQHFNPTLPAKRAAHYLPYEKTVEPSLYITPTMDTWYVQHPRRPLTKIPPTEFQFVSPTLQTGPVDGLDTFVVVVDGSDSAVYAVEASDTAKYRVTGSDGSY